MHDIANAISSILEGQDTAADSASAPSPHLRLSPTVSGELKPPTKPFRARPFFKPHRFTLSLTAADAEAGKAEPAKGEAKTEKKSEGKVMSDRFSSDRLAAFAPQIQRRIADIPNPAAVRAAEAETDGKRLHVGKQIRMKGEIAGCERLVVDGQVDATLSDVKTLELSAGGSFKGEASVDSAVIAGIYEGNLVVRGHLEIAATGTVKGSVTYKTIMVANGGKVEGTITVA